MQIADIKPGMLVYFYVPDGGERVGYVVRVTRTRMVHVLYEKTSGVYVVIKVEPAHVQQNIDQYKTPTKVRATMRRYVRRVRARDNRATKAARVAADVVEREVIDVT